jgi:guanylate kinase
MERIPLLVITGYSSSGKTTLAQALIAAGGGKIVRAVTYTTRTPREGEQPGVDYHFLDTDTFAELQAAGEFLETNFHYGNYYGTAKPHTLPVKAEQILLYLVDPNGALFIKQEHPQAILFFISITEEEQIRRLGQRDGVVDSETRLARRERYAQERLILETHPDVFTVLTNTTPADLDGMVAKVLDTLRQAGLLEAEPAPEGVVPPEQ